MEYAVDVQTVLSNDVRASVTGAVNGRQVAATVLLADLPSGSRGEIQANARSTGLNQALAEALVDVYEGRDVNVQTLHPGLISVRR